jgi:hypothetical protein
MIREDFILKKTDVSALCVFERTISFVTQHDSLHGRPVAPSTMNNNVEKYSVLP